GAGGHAGPDPDRRPDPSVRAEGGLRRLRRPRAVLDPPSRLRRARTHLMPLRAKCGLDVMLDWAFASSQASLRSIDPERAVPSGELLRPRAPLGQRPFERPSNPAHGRCTRPAGLVLG